jgi:hypothetical protein
MARRAAAASLRRSFSTLYEGTNIIAAAAAITAVAIQPRTMRVRLAVKAKLAAPEWGSEGFGVEVVLIIDRQRASPALSSPPHG